MSGHSKWAGIKHKKALVDAKKGKVFTQVANMIAVAARQGGGDPKTNFSLRLAIEKAKSVNMPAVNIERAINRGTGEGGGTRIEELVYEGYGPSGIAVLVEAASDNKNRTVSEIRSTFTKFGGSLATAGAVSYLFEKKGQITIDLQGQNKSKEEIELLVIESGADDFEESENSLIVYAKVADLAKVKEYLETSGIKIKESAFVYLAKNEVPVKDKDKAASILKLMNALEELDDVVAVHSNFDIDSDLLENLRC